MKGPSRKLDSPGTYLHNSVTHHQLGIRLSLLPLSCLRSLNMVRAPIVHNIFEPNTCTWQYVVADPPTAAAVVIDSVLDFDPSKALISTETADILLSLIRQKGYRIEKILETHVHADHLTAAKYLQHRLQSTQGSKPDICIGKRIGEVQERFASRYGVPKEEMEGAFDKMFDDDEVFKVGELEAKVLHLPGHTPDHLGYVIGGKPCV